MYKVQPMRGYDDFCCLSRRRGIDLVGIGHDEVIRIGISSGWACKELQAVEGKKARKSRYQISIFVQPSSLEGLKTILRDQRHCEYLVRESKLVCKSSQPWLSSTNAAVACQYKTTYLVSQVWFMWNETFWLSFSAQWYNACRRYSARSPSRFSFFFSAGGRILMAACRRSNADRLF